MKNNDIKFTISARNDEKIIYGSVLLDTASIETILAINDELFDEDTRYQVEASVDGERVYCSPFFSRADLDKHLEESELAVEKVIE